MRAALFTPQPVSGDAHNDPSYGWADRLHIGSRGQPSSSAANAAIVLSRDERWVGVLERDERRAVARFAMPPPLASGLSLPSSAYPRSISSSDLVAIQAWLQEEVGAVFEPNTVNQAVENVAELRRRDPVREYLTALRWDGAKRLDTWLATYCGAPDDEYAAKVGRLWLLSAVARTMKPGCQADYLLVLEGRQGSGKSSALRALVPEADLFTDAPLDFRHKDGADALRGPWIVELSEMDALSRSEVTAVKAFISRRVDRYRSAYATRTGDYPRRVVFAGTTNEGAYLRDPTGARRFWPVRCGARLDVRGLERDRDQLWAEAHHAYAAGEPWWPDAHLEQLASAEQEARYQGDEWEGVISGYVDGRQETTVREVAEDALNIEFARLDPTAQKRIVSALQRLGWRSTGNPLWRPIKGTKCRVRVYVRPRDEAA